MSRTIQVTTPVGTHTIDLATVPALVARWYRPRHTLIWAELRRLGKQLIVEPKPEPKPARKPLRFAV